ncbi:hypothetical protein HU200_046987 [Digitaria exilis]|uniref:F-box associated beta-propeller type 3 domain-containing protein n=1 Tax=Digitaria exilis TaxID=1010633 RepID=A0A835AYJ7_9POAL|nr:hypothetical protein HU200_046987 [Digitaria exilis]
MQVPAQEGVGRVMSIQLGLICTKKWMTRDYQLLNPVRTPVCALPDGFAKEHAWKLGIFDHEAFLSFGKTRLIGDKPTQLCEIFMLGGKDSQWRKKKAPGNIVYLDIGKSVVMDGAVYFLSYFPDCIASFDLHTEVWREALQGPPSSLVDDDSTFKLYWSHFSLATLNGCLVVVHHKPVISPLFVLDDGRIVLMEMKGQGFIRTYNPRSNTLADIAVVGNCVAVGLYTGSLLSPFSSAIQ